MISSFIRKLCFRDFLEVELSSVEKQIAIESIEKKYAGVLRSSLLWSLFVVPAILFLETSIIVSVLIPVTMVSGTAWFAISLANVKKKFQDFGLELTTNLLESFVLSLFILFLLTFFTLNSGMLPEWVATVGANPAVQVMSGLMGTLVVGRVIFCIYLGSLKYDMNDAMLTGQTEVAERFYKRSLSFLYQSAAALKGGKNLEVANYHIGNCFFELFSFIKAHLNSLNVNNSKLDGLIENALSIRNDPALEQKAIDEQSINLIENFMRYVQCSTDREVEKSMANIEQELGCLKKNGDESQQLIDTRFATIFEEIASAMESEGESLFDRT